MAPSAFSSVTVNDDRVRATPSIWSSKIMIGIGMASRDGSVYVLFERESENLGDAVGSAIKQVVGAGHRVAKVEVEAAVSAGA